MAPSQFSTRQGASLLFNTTSSSTFSLACDAPSTTSSTTQSNLRFQIAPPVYNPISKGMFASISSSIFLQKQGEKSKGSSSGAWKEKHTGVEFPAEFCDLKTSNCPTLLSMGVRTKSILFNNINVYALGVYVDEAAAQKGLSSLSSKGAASTSSAGGARKGTNLVVPPAANQQVFDALIDSDGIEKTLRLVITSGMVSRKRFVDALDERIKPHLIKESEQATLDAFHHLFDGVDFEKGLEICFTQRPNAQLMTRIKGESAGIIHSKALCHSLFGAYLGPEPVVKDVKTGLASALAAIIL